MARRAQADQVLFDMLSAVAPEDLMMNLNVLHAAADLTSPAVAAKDLKSHVRGNGARQVG